MKLLKILKETDHFISGETLCERLNITRAAVWKQIKKLKQNGYRIESRKGLGYQLLSSPDRPVQEEVEPWLKTNTFGRSIIFFEECDSTNRIAGDLAAQGAEEGTLVITDRQTAGRGRQAREWFSPKGSNLYVSLILCPQVPPQQVAQASLVVAVGIAEALEALFPELEFSIKWPNDILTPRGKLAGILCDVKAELDRVHYLIVGIGMNINLEQETLPEELKGIAVSLLSETGAVQSRSRIVAELMNHLETAWRIWLKDGLSPLLEAWNRRSLLHGKTVVVDVCGTLSEGIVQGLSERGALLLKTPEGDIREILSGDVHVKSIHGSGGKNG